MTKKKKEEIKVTEHCEDCGCEAIQDGQEHCTECGGEITDKPDQFFRKEDQ